jgi:hypothetical protein
MKHQSENNKQLSCRNRRRRKKKTKTYITKGQINRVVDTLLHPTFRKEPKLRLLNGFIHALVEQEPKSSMKKFVRYHLLPQLFKEEPDKKKKKNANK